MPWHIRYQIDQIDRIVLCNIGQRQMHSSTFIIHRRSSMLTGEANMLHMGIQFIQENVANECLGIQRIQEGKQRLVIVIIPNQLGHSIPDLLFCMGRIILPIQYLFHVCADFVGLPFADLRYQRLQCLICKHSTAIAVGGAAVMVAGLVDLRQYHLFIGFFRLGYFHRNIDRKINIRNGRIFSRCAE